jgi:hypothetical protein
MVCCNFFWRHKVHGFYVCLQVVEYRGEKVRRSVADLREAKYRSEGKDCYVSLLFKIDCNTRLYLS